MTQLMDLCEVNGFGELVPMSAEAADAFENDPERFCREFCHGGKRDYDPSVTEGPCFNCELFC